MSVIIGIIGRPNDLDGPKMTFSRFVIDTIIDYKAIPLGILPVNKNISKSLDNEQKEKLFKMIDLCDGIILQGGIDLYDYDVEAIRYINKKDIPLLGICLGMQSMAVATGGKLGKISEHWCPGVSMVHNVNVDSESLFYNIVKKSIIGVNSRHNDYVLHAGEYKVVGHADDGTIEVLELSDRRCNIGVQWHPEELKQSKEEAKKLFDYFFECCSDFRR